LIENRFLHDSHSGFFRNPFGAAPSGEKIVLRFMIKDADEQTGEAWQSEWTEQAEWEVYLHLNKEIAGRNHEVELKMAPEAWSGSGVDADAAWSGSGASRRSPQPPVRSGDRVFRLEILAPEKPCLLWYYFIIRSRNGTFYYGNSPGNTGGPGAYYPHQPPSYQITVYKNDLKIPAWYQKSIMYQIFPDRFFNGNEDGKIFNAKKNSLLHAHWNNSPLYIRELPSGKVLRWDFFGGNLEGVRKKLAYLKNLGVTLIYFNPVFEASSNHRYDTADYHKIDPMLGDNELFRRLCREAKNLGMNIILDGVFSHTGSDSIYFNKMGNYPSLGAYQSEDSPYRNWYRFSEYPDSYDSWWGIDTLPNVNELEPSYLEHIMTGENSVLKYWIEAGIKGWRLDVADELPPEFLKKLHAETKKQDPEAILIGEVWEDASNKMSYGERRDYLLGEELDGVINYPLRTIILDFVRGWKSAPEVHLELMSLYENYPLQHFYSTMNLLGGHDVPRVITALGEGLAGDIPPHEKKALVMKRLKMATLWQLTFPGVPCIYYGDEAGLEGGTDPYNRGPYPWGREDAEIMHWYRSLIALRNHYDVLSSGSWRTLHASGSVFSYARFMENGLDVFGEKRADNTAIIIMNRDAQNTQTVSLDLSAFSLKGLVDPLQNYRRVALDGNILRLTLQPLESRLLLGDRWSSNSLQERDSGVLLHPTSLPSDFGIGDLGKGAFDFIDFLAEAGQSYWQILPLNPPGLGESPYQCFSAFAGNHLLIDPEKLAEDGLLPDLEKRKEISSFAAEQVDFQSVREFKDKCFAAAFENFAGLAAGVAGAVGSIGATGVTGGVTGAADAAYKKFCNENAEWLDDYALFMALKEHFNGASWDEWEKLAALRDKAALDSYRKTLAARIDYHKFLQYIFFKQWRELKDYAREKGVKIIGDLPIFVSHDSSDVWRHPSFFELDENGKAAKVAGVPPDYFSKTGQMWGNPHYRWAEMAQDNYSWWSERFRLLFQLVDLIRIDHFRGFEAYWEIPAGMKTAVKGKWVKGPGEDFFHQMQKSLGHFPVILEDLGLITPEVVDMKTKLGLPGMKVMQFMMEPRPDRNFEFPLYEKETILYTGTHDNDTILGWYGQGRKGWKTKTQGEKAEIALHFVEAAMSSDAGTVIIPLQDILALDSEARMNTPGTVEGNWLWRFPAGLLTAELAAGLRGLTEKYHRRGARQG